VPSFKSGFFDIFKGVPIIFHRREKTEGPKRGGVLGEGHACMHACMHAYIHTYIHLEFDSAALTK